MNKVCIPPATVSSHSYLALSEKCLVMSGLGYHRDRHRLLELLFYVYAASTLKSGTFVPKLLLRKYLESSLWVTPYFILQKDGAASYCKLKSAIPRTVEKINMQYRTYMQGF